MTAPALELRGVGRSFLQGGRTLDVLKGINLSLAPGELVALVGASGSGKSTLLQIAGLLDQPSEGAIVVAGQDCSQLGDGERTALRRDALGFVYQFHHLLPDFSALENVSVAGRVQGMGARQAKGLAAERLNELGLGERLDHVPSKLSGGEQQRVAIARALMGDPLVLLADEPTGNLDDDTSERVFDLMLEAVTKRRVAALIVTHDRRLAEKAHRTLALKAGQLGPIAG